MNAKTIDIDKLSGGSPTGVPALPRLAYSLAETADALGLSRATIGRLIKRGLLRSSGQIRHKLIAATEIQSFLERTAS